MNTLAEFIKGHRHKKGITFRALSKKVGIAPSVLFKYEKGLNYPKDRILKEICNELDLSFEQMKLVIIEEKSKKALENSTYPSLREIFIKSYNAEYAMWKKEAVLSQKKLEYEFGGEEIHPIEQKLIDETNKRLHENKLINSNESIIDDKFSASKKRQLFKKVITDWGYNPKFRQLIIGFTPRKGLLQAVCYKVASFGWVKTPREI